jgi:hypothetical protein
MSRSTESTVIVWRKARRSQEQGACVEVGDLPGIVAVRDSKNPTGPMLAFPRTTWRSFAGRVKSDQFDL